MCGIAGKIGGKSSKEIEFMLDKINGRGDTPPHHEQVGKAVLGSVHLRIVDINNGEQPIYNEEETIAVVFNGEIYNYLDLKIDLESKGHIFRTISDTEVLVHLYEEYGESMLLHLDGMFAFMIYDIKAETFFGARDYFGVKPFYYCWHNKEFFFSSEMKSFELIPATEIFELKPSEYIKNGSINKFYEIPSDPVYTCTFLEAKSTVRELLRSSIKKRVQTELPIGVLFSGGIDSTITLHLCKEFHQNVTALILGEDDSDDVEYAKWYCDTYNIQYEHQLVDIDQLLETIPETIYRIESFEPNPVRGSVLSTVLGKFANSLGLKVLLCGEGSDEIFAGYGDFLNITDDHDFQNLSISLLKDLYRTQLLRVDRTAMAHGIEVREPFLDKALVEFALSLPPSFKIGSLSNGKKTTKLILREAFKDILPNKIYERPKMTLMEGTGVSSVNPGEGVFFEYASKKIDNAEFENLKVKFPAFKLADKEEAYYFTLFHSMFPNAGFASNRTINAQLEILILNGN